MLVVGPSQANQCLDTTVFHTQRDRKRKTGGFHPTTDSFFRLAAAFAITIVTAATAQLQYHVNGRPRGDVVRFQRVVIGQLFAAEDQFDLIHLDALLLLQRLFHGQDLIFRFEVKGLFTTRQGLDEDLCETKP